MSNACSLSDLHQKHGLHLQSIVEDNIQAESKRQSALRMVHSNTDRRKLECGFRRQRASERIRIQRIQQEHQSLIDARLKTTAKSHITQPTNPLHGGTQQGFGTSTKRCPASSLQSSQRKSSMTAKLRNSKPKNTLAGITTESDYHRNRDGSVEFGNRSVISRGSSCSALSNPSRSKFLHAMYAKHDRKAPVALTEYSLYKATSSCSESVLLKEKHRLLTKLNNVVHQQQGIYNAEVASTVRSSVSSFGSPRSRSSNSTIKYRPFQGV